MGVRKVMDVGVGVTVIGVVVVRVGVVVVRVGVVVVRVGVVVVRVGVVVVACVVCLDRKDRVLCVGLGVRSFIDFDTYARQTIALLNLNLERILRRVLQRKNGVVVGDEWAVVEEVRAQGLWARWDCLKVGSVAANESGNGVDWAILRVRIDTFPALTGIARWMQTRCLKLPKILHTHSRSLTSPNEKRSRLNSRAPPKSG